MTLSEFQLIHKIKSLLPADNTNLGIGDDCAVIKGAPYDTLVTTDILAEDVHFKLDYYSFADVGYKSCIVNASDILAMGGEVTGFFVSIAVPKKLTDENILDFYAGFKEAMLPFGVTILGGDTTSSPSGFFISITAVGRVPTGKALLRSGAKAGDNIYVLGRLGESAYGLHLLLDKGVRDRNDTFVKAHLRPRLFPNEWRKIREGCTITAAIDVSDGLFADLGHILEESRSGAEIDIDGDAWAPVSGLLSAGITKDEALGYIRSGGEDYALLFTSPDRVDGALAIGRIIDEAGLYRRTPGGRLRLEAKGYKHF
ncbi:MAG: thiamine-phosphate kinase [Spirochaetota bacterium]